MDNTKYNELLKQLNEERNYILKRMELPNNLNPKRKVAKRMQLKAINSRIKGLKLFKDE